MSAPLTFDINALGPAMRALPSDRMRRYCLAIVRTGCSQKAAAEMAGYVGNANTLKAAGHKLSRDRRIIAALREEADRVIQGSTFLSLSALIEIVADRTHKDRLKAAVELLSRAGFSPRVPFRPPAEGEATEAEKVAEIVALASSLGMDPRELLGQAGIHPMPVEADLTSLQTQRPEAVQGDYHV